MKKLVEYNFTLCYLRILISLYLNVGIRVIYNLNKPQGQEIESILIRCQNCTIPVYQPIQLDKYYKIAIPSFLSSGGDRLDMLKKNLKNLVIGPVDTEAFEYYIQHRSPIFAEEDERIVIHGSDKIRYRNIDS